MPVTIVTALFDLERGDRPYETYLSYMTPLLQMKQNMVIFVEHKAEDWIWAQRAGLKHKTRVVAMNKDEMPLAYLRPKVEEVMASDAWKVNNELYEHNQPQGKIPWYNILMSSKGLFVKRVIDENPFKTDYFAWIDAGFGHGDPDKYYPSDRRWHPCFTKAQNFKGKVLWTLVRDVSKEDNDIRNSWKKWHLPAFAGCAFAGHKDALLQYAELHKQVFVDLLAEGIVTEDQPLVAECNRRRPDLFATYRGEWFDFMKVTDRRREDPACRLCGIW
eukprot:TRINITY_DN483_c0_g1_i1.p1 TRINITY_DN483_c0_g1~~TRINITY_DN483_c0_g1_i1.p1  ORF type:complete len:274 (-),score=33.37 TRINITY_DN483_c0_g1_i1:30-851(-)